MALTKYHAKYFAHDLTRRYPSDSLQKFTQTLSNAQVDLNPHQIEAALFAFKSPLSSGAILADEVGLGKTIEAGILLSQFWAERKKRILIIAPSNLRKQWNQELIDKFFLPSVILEAQSFNAEIKDGNSNPFLQEEIVICSYHFARNKDEYIQSVDWDLIVIDEAHRLRNVYKKSNKISNAIREATEHAPKVLLTATPLQNSLLELYGLVSFVDNYTFGDLKSFKSQFSRLNGDDSFEDLRNRLKIVSHRTLRRQVLEYVRFTNRYPLVQEFEPHQDEEKLANLVEDYLKRKKLFALPSSQRQLMSLILFKLLASSTFAISGTLNGLAEKLETMLKKQKRIKSVLDTIADNVENINEISDEWGEEEYDEDDLLSEEELNDLRSEIEELKEFTTLAQSIKKNSKGDQLLTALARGFEDTEKKGGNKKAIIFTESTRTQAYLLEILENSDEYKGKVVLFNGTNNDKASNKIYKDWLKKNENSDKITGSKMADKRAAIVDYFRNEATIMIATEAAAEGINLQFCSLIVNYDLPWNPQRIEQRIGRCHRYGQKYDVVVVNFINKSNSADQRVYELLDQKFKLFEGVFGASDEVLGAIESGVDFEKRIVQIYQNCRTSEEIEQSFNELQKEMEANISEKMASTRQKLLENFDEEVVEKLKTNLAESTEYLNVFDRKLWSLTKFFLEDFADFSEVEDSFKLLENPFPKLPFREVTYKFARNVQADNLYRIGHPLAQSIINECKSYDLPDAELIFDYSGDSKKISILENLLDKSGWMIAKKYSIDTVESEDHIILSACTDSGESLDADQCQRLFSLDAQEVEINSSIPKDIAEKLNTDYEIRIGNILEENKMRNSGYFDLELEKLDKWAEDRKNSLEIKLKELEVEIKTKKTESRKILKLEEKVKMQREIKELEKNRNNLRQTLFQSQDEIDEKKENLLDDIESRLKHKIDTQKLFTIRWKIR